MVDPIQRLAPRQRQTLALILQGKSEKEIANVIGISRHTAHCYCKQLMRAYGVCSRPELMSKFIPSEVIESFGGSLRQESQGNESLTSPLPPARLRREPRMIIASAVRPTRAKPVRINVQIELTPVIRINPRVGPKKRH